jgi:hypothetical protein
VDAPALLDLLAELASEAGFRVQVLSAGTAREGEFPPQSGHCRVKGEVRVILAAQEPLEDRIEALADALRSHAASFLESRFLAPAVRERIERGRS